MPVSIRRRGDPMHQRPTVPTHLNLSGQSISFCSVPPIDETNWCPLFPLMLLHPCSSQFSAAPLLLSLFPAFSMAPHGPSPTLSISDARRGLLVTHWSLTGLLMCLFLCASRSRSRYHILRSIYRSRSISRSCSHILRSISRSRILRSISRSHIRRSISRSHIFRSVLVVLTTSKVHEMVFQTLILRDFNR